MRLDSFVAWRSVSCCSSSMRFEVSASSSYAKGEADRRCGKSRTARCTHLAWLWWRFARVRAEGRQAVIRACTVLISPSLPVCGAASGSNGGLDREATSGIGGATSTTSAAAPTTGAADSAGVVGTSATVTTTEREGSSAGPKDSSSAGDPDEPPPARAPAQDMGGGDGAALPGVARALAASETSVCEAGGVARERAIRSREWVPSRRPGARSDRAGAGSCGSACATDRSDFLNMGWRRRPWS